MIAFFFINLTIGVAQMPPPGYERAKKIQEEKEKMPLMDRDSMTLIDTSVVFDPITYEEEVLIISSKISVRDYCIRYLGIGNPEMLLDRNPHTIIDPKTYEEITIKLNQAGTIDTLPK